MSAAALQHGTVPLPLPPSCRRERGTEGIATVESWRVVSESAGGAIATTDAVVRLRSGDDRLLVTGEATTAEAALLDALQTAEKILPGSTLDLGESLQTRLEANLLAPNVSIEATSQQGLVGRLAVLLNAHDVSSFNYRVDPARSISVLELVVHGGDSQVARVAQKLRRVIGVLQVTAVLADSGEDSFLRL